MSDRILTTEQVRERLSPTHEHEQVFDSHERLREQRDEALGEEDQAHRLYDAAYHRANNAEDRLARVAAALERIALAGYVKTGVAGHEEHAQGDPRLEALADMARVALAAVEDERRNDGQEPAE